MEQPSFGFAACRSPHQMRVDSFMRKAKQELPERPTIPSFDVRLLRARLIMEEALETILALGFIPIVESFDDGDKCRYRPWVSMGDLEFERTATPPDLPQIIDGCADLSVVTIGTLSACGVPDIPVLTLVDTNNLDKFGPGHRLSEHGKLIKPPNHKPPDIEGWLAQLRNETN